MADETWCTQGMRALVQRVTEARARVDGEADAAWLAAKVAGLRVFDDDRGVMNLSLADTTRTVLVVSQFTLYADTHRGHRPSWAAAAPAARATPLVDAFTAALAALGAHVATGRFGAHMSVELVNDGPVTVAVEV